MQLSLLNQSNLSTLTTPRNSFVQSSPASQEQPQNSHVDQVSFSQSEARSSLENSGTSPRDKRYRSWKEVGLNAFKGAVKAGVATALGKSAGSQSKSFIYNSSLVGGYNLALNVIDLEAQAMISDFPIKKNLGLKVAAFKSVLTTLAGSLGGIPTAAIVGGVAEGLLSALPKEILGGWT